MIFLGMENQPRSAKDKEGVEKKKRNKL